uniref:DOG1 domain-containing protein n=2 Tax=Glycine subgen. Soja TaxID=1462606 RepID=A0A0R0FNW6_SOYBN
MSVFRCTHTTEKDNYESFQEFFECWMFEQNQHLKELVAAESTTHLTDEKLQALNGKVVEHYEQYYNAKLCKARCVGHMQRRIIFEEREVTHLMESHQETVADAPIVELSHLRGEVGEDKEIEEKVIESALVPLMEGLEQILLKADELRLRTLKAIVNVLTPKQAIHFLIADAELYLRVHEWGKKMDSRKGNHVLVRVQVSHSSSKSKIAAL